MLLEELRFSDKAGLERARAEWGSRGVATRATTVGQVYGIAGHVVDTRRHALLADGDATESGARAQADTIAARFPAVHPQLFRELASRPSGRIELLDQSGAVRAVGESAVREAAGKTHVDLQLLEERRQPPDHPVLLAFPEGRYLKFFVFRRAD